MRAFSWQRACGDCRGVWGLEYEDDGNTVANETDCVCPDCGSTAVEPLAKAQERAERLADAPNARAERLADAPNARADHAYDRARDGEIA